MHPALGPLPAPSISWFTAFSKPPITPRPHTPLRAAWLSKQPDSTALLPTLSKALGKGEKKAQSKPCGAGGQRER